MKLPSKIEVNTQIASQRKAQIDEGLRIAEKVDALRLKLADLEAQHEKFISGMEGELEQRTGNLVQQVANLQKDIADLEEQKRQLRIPLDAEWHSLKQSKEDMETIAALLDKRESAITLKEQVQDTRDRKSKELKVIANTRDRESKKAYDETVSMKKETENILAEAKIFKEKTAQEIADEHYALDQRLNAIDAQERVFEAKEKEFAERDKEMESERRQLADQRKTLERELARLKK